MLVVAACAASLLVLAPSALASTVRVVGTTVDIDGDPGQNVITIGYVVSDGGTPGVPGDDVGYVKVTDSGVAPQPGDASCGYSNDYPSDPAVYCEDVGGAIDKYDVNLGSGDDRLTVTAYFTSGTTEGGAGNDEVNGAEGGDATYPGNDTFNGGPDNDSFFGNVGDDTFNGGDGNDEALGNVGKDLLRGEGGEDRLLGQDDEDRLFGGDANDRVEGGPGNDPDVSGEAGNDEVFGGAGDDLVRGGDGDDKLEYQFVYSAAGQGAGRDDISGGNGKDAIDYGDHSGGVTITLDEQANDGTSSEGDNVRNDVEVVEGSDGNDTLNGNDGVNELNGDSGDDTINGGGGDDTLNGGIGKDRIFGNAGVDKLEGSSDEDFLDGGAGRDTFEGDPPCTLNGCSGGSDDINARDGEEDRVNCGVGADKVIADQFDIIATDPQQGCETVDRQTVGVTPPPGPPAGADPNALKVTPTTLRKLLKRGLRFTIGCPAACTISAQLKLKRTTLGKTSKSLLAAGKASLTLKVSKKMRSKLKRLRRARLVLVVTVKDAAGKSTRHTKTLNLRR